MSFIREFILNVKEKLLFFFLCTSPTSLYSSSLYDLEVDQALICIKYTKEAFIKDVISQGGGVSGKNRHL